MTDDRADDLTRSADATTGLTEPPAANQQKDEPAGAGDEGTAGSATDVRATSLPPGADGGIPTPGDAQGVAVPSVQAAAGTSEQSERIDDVTTTALAPPGRPDGEVDTRPAGSRAAPA